MIEFCSRKRMVIAILLLFSLTMVTLIVEGMWSTNHKLAEINLEKDESQAQCASADVKIVHECQPCTAHENVMKMPYCVGTGYKEEVTCSNKEAQSFQRSCKADRWLEEKKFWIFQLVTCLVGFCSYGVVKYRQSNLDKTLTEKVNRQIAA